MKIHHLKRICTRTVPHNHLGFAILAVEIVAWTQSKYTSMSEDSHFLADVQCAHVPHCYVGYTVLPIDSSRPEAELIRVSSWKDSVAAWSDYIRSQRVAVSWRPKFITAVEQYWAQSPAKYLAELYTSELHSISAKQSLLLDWSLCFHKI